MNAFQKCSLLIILGFLAIAAVPFALAEDKAKPPSPPAKQAEATAVERGWQKRCDEVQVKEKKEKYCEVFQRLDVKESSKRVAEIAVGFPEGKDAARGVVVLPLGILLEKITMKVDDSKPAVFNVRYCNSDGCFSFINLGKDIIDAMKKGKKILFSFKTLEGQDVNIFLNLEGFEKVFKEIQPK